MKQVLQNVKTGETNLEDIPCPRGRDGELLIESATTLVSVGTERMIIEFGKANWVEKARSQPDKVKMVLEKVKSDGVGSTIEAVQSKLDQPLPLGYCNVGTVLENGKTNFSVGERVVSNGAHAEIVRVPKNLCAKIPSEVDNESAAFTVLGSIALQGVRLAQPSLGECFVVTGLGLIGLLAVQILRANGCRVLGIDFDSHKCELARGFGAETVDLSRGEDPLGQAVQFSRGIGVDGVLITASTKSNDPVSQAAKMCRQRGRIVLIGVVGLELSRADFYEKELSFQVSCSYGPGRYDKNYEEKGHDYPVGFVRWTEQRNFEAVLDLMASGKLDCGPLITHRFGIDEAVLAYTKLDDRSALGILLDYGKSAPQSKIKSIVRLKETEVRTEGKARCAFLGAGNYASRILMPAFKAAGAMLDTVVTSGGISGIYQGGKAGFLRTSTDLSDVISDPDIDTVVIATQHNLHASQVVECITSGKNVFVEKPLALDLEELRAITSFTEERQEGVRLMIGFNRRFSPHIQKMSELLASINEPKSFIFTMNAGAIPADHWTQDPLVGGGRIIGEACHYVDLMRYLVGAPISGFSASKMGEAPGVAISEDKASITLTFEDGSLGTIHYFANGGKIFPKERIEVFANNSVLQLDDFKTLRGYGWKGFKRSKSSTQQKGQIECVAAFVDSIRNGNPSPIPLDEVIEVSRIAVEIGSSLRT